MKEVNYFRLFSFSLISVFFFFPSDGNAKELLEKFDFTLSGGYRVDELNWNHAGQGVSGFPNVRSELTWDDLEIYQLSNEMKLDWQDTTMPIGYALRSQVNYGTITSGDNQDSDFDSDNRTDEFSRSNNNAGDGNVWDASFAVGVTFFKHSKVFSLTPLVGYSYHEQNLTMTDGYQTIDTYFNNTGPFDGLDTTYDARWKGAFVGCELQLYVNEKFSFNSTVELHDADYDSEANWNLRSTLKHPVSFTNVSDDGSGVLARGGFLYELTKTYHLNLNLEYKKWEAENGFHTEYRANGTTATVKLNEVNWESRSISIGLTIRYH